MDSPSNLTATADTVGGAVESLALTASTPNLRRPNPNRFPTGAPVEIAGPAPAHDPTAPLTPHNIAPEILDLIMVSVCDDDISSCTRVNSAFYLAAKPHLFRVVHLNKNFHIRATGCPLLDCNIKGTNRPAFRREWLTRCTHTLEVAVHHESLCGRAINLEASLSCPYSLCSVSSTCFRCALTPLAEVLPPLPHLHTIRMPLDIHGTLQAKIPPAPCGMHKLPGVRHIVYRNFFWTLENPTTSSFAFRSLDSCTIFLAGGSHLFHPSSAVIFKDVFRPCALVTIVYPERYRLIRGEKLRHASLPFPWPLPGNKDPLAIYADVTGCRVDGEGNHANGCLYNLFINVGKYAAACAVTGTANVHLVGFDELASNSDWGREWARSHFAFVTRAHFANFSPFPRREKWIRANDTEKFILRNRSEWAKNAPGRFALTTRQRSQWQAMK